MAKTELLAIEQYSTYMNRPQNVQPRRGYTVLAGVVSPNAIDE
jgi:hypothetical protein